MTQTEAFPGGFTAHGFDAGEGRGMQDVGGPLRPPQEQRIAHIETQRVEKAAQNKQAGFKEPFAVSAGRTKDGPGRTAWPGGGTAALAQGPAALGAVDETLQGGGGAIEIDGGGDDERVGRVEPLKEPGRLVVKDAGTGMIGTEAAADAGADVMVPQPDGFGKPTVGRKGLLKNPGDGISRPARVRAAREDEDARVGRFLLGGGVGG